MKWNIKKLVIVDKVSSLRNFYYKQPPTSVKRRLKRDEEGGMRPGDRSPYDDGKKITAEPIWVARSRAYEATWRADIWSKSAERNRGMWSENVMPMWEAIILTTVVEVPEGEKELKYNRSKPSERKWEEKSRKEGIWEIKRGRVCRSEAKINEHL